MSIATSNSNSNSTSATLFVGVDTHKKFNVVSLMDGPSGEPLGKTLGLPNNLPGTRRLADYLASQLSQHHYAQFQLAIEAGAWSGWHFLHALNQAPQLTDYPHKLYALNPRPVVNFKRTFPELNHQDKSDATVLADRLRFGRKLPQPFHYEPQVLALRLLTRHHCHLAHFLSEEKTYALALVMQGTSEYTQLPNAPLNKRIFSSRIFFSISFSSSTSYQVEFLPTSFITCWRAGNVLANFPCRQLVEGT